MSELQIQANDLAVALYRAEQEEDVFETWSESHMDLHRRWLELNDQFPLHAFVAAYRLATREIGIADVIQVSEPKDPQAELDFERENDD